MKRFIFFLWMALMCMGISAQSLSDLGNGKYKNPVIFADFPDPDVIRVGDTYYMVSTTMVNFPGATIVKSKDLVNWEYCAQPLKQLSTQDKYSLLNGKNAYAGGMWACSMKYHNGKFHILINGNDAGPYMLTATDPEGTWEKHQLSRGYYDPGMLFDNGKLYVACGINQIKMCELDEQFNFKQEKTVVTREGTGLEGCHLYKIGDYYYIYATYGGWPSGQAVFRSKNIFGPYEEKMLMEKFINGAPNTIHQGALIDVADENGDIKEWWTILQQDLGCLGRMPNLQPVTWVDDWPILGNKGVPYTTYTKPNTVGSTPAVPMPTSDGFRTYTFGMQWQWNHNPDNNAWSLLERPGWLRLKPSGKVNRLTQARNMLTQRIFVIHNKPSQESTGTIRLDVSHLQEGDRAGICILQDPYAAIAVEVKDGKKQLVWWQDQLTTNNNFTPSQKTVTKEIGDIVYLRAAVTYSTSKTQFYYSLDNQTYTRLGSQTTLGFNLSVFVGARFGLFCYSSRQSTGYADFDWFSTDKKFDEDDFYGGAFEGYSDAPIAKSINVNGKWRSYWLHVPKDCQEGAPLVVAMHGAGGGSSDQSPNFNEIADAEKFIVAYPQGEPISLALFGGTVTGWNASGDDNADVVFIKAMIDEIEQNYQIDRNRIYCCGFSNGGMNAYALANACSDVFAACASISGFPLSEFHLRHTGQRPVPFLHIHGKQDDLAKYSLMPTIVDEMVARLGANPVPVKTSVSGKYDKSVYEAADGSFPYVYYEIDGMGHNDFTTNTEDSNSSLTMWKFFKQYTLDMPYDATLRWRPRIEEEGFNPKEHGWTMNSATTLLSLGGPQKTNDNQNVYHSLQLPKGTYKLTFRSEGDADQTVGVKIRRLPSNTLIYENTVKVNEPATLFFTTDSKWSEYKFLLTRQRSATITVKDIRIDASSEEEASGIRELTAPQPQDGKWYSLSGIPVSRPSKGIYIKNGKKIVK
ncbi:MAG: family 43 glycosylhydrolase [Prevotella sp.]|nr:family 43 glycosylhydrolase [Prevotella sp.]